MNKTSAVIASSTFILIAIVLIIYSWVPFYDGLLSEKAKIISITKRPGTIYKVEFRTQSGIILTCKARRQWPPKIINACPLEKFEKLKGQPIIVLHNGKHPFEIRSLNGKIIVSYKTHRLRQLFLDIVALFMLFIGVFILVRMKNLGV